MVGGSAFILVDISPPSPLGRYEAKLDAAKRIIWEVAVTFSERRSRGDEASAVWAEVIRVWTVVEDHDDISAEVEKVVVAHRRGETCFLKTPLASVANPLAGGAAAASGGGGGESPRGEDGQRAAPSPLDGGGGGGENGDAEVVAYESARRGAQGPRTFSAAEAGGLVHYPPASPDPNDYKLLKFYSVTSPTLRSLLNRSGRSDATLPFKVTSKEWAILQLESANAILLLGRSGTGKTSCICYRLAFKWSQYWESSRDCFEVPDDVVSWHARRAVEAEAERAAAADARREDADLEHITRGKGGGGAARAAVTSSSAVEAEAAAAAATAAGAAPVKCHLRQLFLTKNAVLRSQVEDVTRSLCVSFSAEADNPFESAKFSGENRAHDAAAAAAEMAPAAAVKGSGGDDDDNESVASGVTSHSAASGGVAGGGGPAPFTYVPPKGMAGLASLQEVPNERFPLFLTGTELLLALDASMPVGADSQRFHALSKAAGSRSGVGDSAGSGSGSGAAGRASARAALAWDGEKGGLADLNDYFGGDDDEDEDLYDEDLHGDGDGEFGMGAGAGAGDGGGGAGGGGEGGGGGGRGDGGRGDKGVAAARAVVAATEVTLHVFKQRLWPKMKARGGDAAASKGGSHQGASLDPALVWTEIKSYIKGSVEGMLAHLAADDASDGLEARQARLKQAYLGLGRKRVSMDAGVRERVWELYLVYQRLRREQGLWDEGDLVLNLYRRLRRHGPSGILFHHCYVDEVQDFTQAELLLVGGGGSLGLFWGVRYTQPCLWNWLRR